MDRSPAKGMKPARLLVVGELCVDIVVALETPELFFGQHEQIVSTTTLTMGGSSAITACGAAALGLSTSLITVCGRDTFGDFLLAELKRRNVNTTAIRIDATIPTGASTHLSRSDGDRAILTSMGSIGAVSIADVPEELFEGFNHLHVGSFFLQKSLWADAPVLFARARAAGLTTSLDGNFDPNEKWDSGILDLLAEVDVFFGNEQELCGITRTTRLATAIELVLDQMRPDTLVVCKLGADGAVVAHRTSQTTIFHRAAAPDAPGLLIDTVGAGDTLAAGFLAARLHGATIDEALALAVASGTASTRGAGGISAQPDLTTAEKIAQTVRVTQAGEMLS